MVGYKGFYGTDNEKCLQDFRYQFHYENEEYILEDDEELVFGKNGHGYHFCRNISQTMPYFYTAFGCENYRVAEIETIKDVKESTEEYGCFVTRGYKITKILSHEELIEIIKTCRNGISESCNILGYYFMNMSKDELVDTLENFITIFNNLSENVDLNYYKMYLIYDGILFLKQKISQLEKDDSHNYNDDLFDYYNNERDKKNYIKKIMQLTKNKTIK